MKKWKSDLEKIVEFSPWYPTAIAIRQEKRNLYKIRGFKWIPTFVKRTKIIGKKGNK